MDNSTAIDTALVFLDTVTVSGVTNVIALARAMDALIQAKQNGKKPDIRPVEEGDSNATSED